MFKRVGVPVKIDVVRSEEISQDTECPKCKFPKTVKSRRKNIVFVEDKNGVSLNPAEYDLIIADECHYLKTQTINRTKLVKGLFKDTKRKLFSILQDLDTYIQN